MRPQHEVDKLFEFLHLESCPIACEVRKDVNLKYFAKYTEFRKRRLSNIFYPVTSWHEQQSNHLGYSLYELMRLGPCCVLGEHNLTS